MTTKIPTVNGSSVDADGILSDKRFDGIVPFKNKVWLSSPTMHGEELAFVKEAIETNWVSTIGKNINELEKNMATYLGMKETVALSCGTAALHMCVKLAAERINPSAKPGNSLEGQRVLCSDMTFDASVNPIVYEGGEPIFVDTEKDTWNMDPESLERAFELYPDVKIVVLAHLYGVPAKMDEIITICRKHNALLIEDAAEALGARYDGEVVSGMCGSFGDFSAISFNGNKIITGSSGGMFVTNNSEDAHKVRKWSTQSREDAPWYQHEELGYNYRMSNIIAGVVRGNMLYTDSHIQSKKAIYERYREGLRDLPITMNPFESKSTPNYWLSCFVIDEDAMEPQIRSGKHYLYKSESGKSCPQEILEALAVFRAEGRPVWKPMHMQPLYRMNGFVVKDGTGRARSNAYIDEGNVLDVGANIYKRGVCLPSDNKMTREQQDVIIEIIHRCFR